MNTSCSPASAEAYRQEGKSKSSLDEFAHTVLTLFPHAIDEYAHLGRSIYRARLDTEGVGRMMALLLQHS